jgi:hypothetical protein
MDIYEHLPTILISTLKKEAVYIVETSAALPELTRCKDLKEESTSTVNNARKLKISNEIAVDVETSLKT